MIGSDGRVVVLDFGLARRHGDLESSVDGEEALDPALTGAGVIVGSPAYMAPEVLRGEEADARSDQFSFCVSLYEALHGVRPFGAGVMRSVEPPDLGALPRPRRVPDWLQALVLRGLAQDPAARHESMDALVTALTRRRLSARTMSVGALGIAALIGAGAGLATVIGRDAPPQPCSQPSERLAEVWNDARRTTLQEALSRGAGEIVAERTTDRLQVYAGAWSDAHRRACRETHVDRTRSERILDLRSACLATRLDEMDALIDVLAESDATVQRLAPAAVDRLPSLEPCSDDAHLNATVPEPDDRERAEHVAELRRALATANALIDAGRYRDGLEAAREVDDRAAAVAFAPLRAETQLAVGLAEHREEHAGAERTLRDAVNVAEASGYDRVAARGWRLLVWAARSDERAELALERLEAVTSRLGEGDADVESLLTARGHLATRTGANTDAIRHFTAALASARARGEAGTVKAAEYLLSLTKATAAAGRYEQALRWSEESEVALTVAYGERHPMVGRARANRATLLAFAGRLEESVELARSAAALQRSVLGPDHPDVGTAVLNLGAAQYRLGQLEDALVSFEDASRINGAVFGPQSPERAQTLGNIARVQADLGRAGEAVLNAEEAVRVLEGRPRDPALAMSLAMLAACYRAAGRPEDAIAPLRRVLAGEVERFGGAHREPALTRIQLAQALLEAGQLDEAHALAQVGLRQLREVHADRVHAEVADALLVSGRIARGQGDADVATAMLTEALTIATKSEGADELADAIRSALAD